LVRIDGDNGRLMVTFDQLADQARDACGARKYNGVRVHTRAITRAVAPPATPLM
jgi:hypothetical protein